MAKITKSFFTGLFLLVALNSVAQVDTEKVAEVFNSYITAQNEHDLATLDKLFIDSPDFLLFYGGKEYWGHTAAMEASEKLHKSALVLEPVSDKQKIVSLSEKSAIVIVPIVYSFREGGKTVKKNLLANITLGHQGEEWKVFSIVTVPSASK